MPHWIDDLSNQLVSQYRAGKLSHANLLIAPSGAGKQQCLSQLGQLILCRTPNNNQACQQCKACALFQAGNHPDLLVVAEEKVIGVDCIRAVGQFVQRTAQLAGNKVIIIHRIEMLTESAANALLKTLEEPAAGCYLLLSATDISEVLPTITSRCQLHFIAVPRGQALASSVTVSAAVNAFSNLSHLPELDDEAQFQLFVDSFNQFTLWLLGDVSYSAMKQKLLQTENALRWLEAYCVMYIRACIQASEPPDLANGLFKRLLVAYDLARLQMLYGIVQSLIIDVKRSNVATMPLSIEQLLLKIEQQVVNAGHS